MPSALDVLRNCRMVLCLPGGRGERLLALKARGVPAVGLDADPASERHCRALGLAAFTGAWSLLHHHRHKFDGVWLEPGLAAPDELPALWAALDECLRPGARLVVAAGLGITAANVPLPFRWLGVVDGLTELQKPRVTLPASPGLRIGPYADLFAGCRSVVELGSGRGHFLDALRLRDLDPLGIEPDAAHVAAATGRGLRMQHGGLEQLATLPVPIDGLFLGHAAAGWSAAQFQTCLSLARSRLARHGRLVVRAARNRLTELLLPAVDRSAWHAVHHGDMPNDAADGFLLLVAGEPVTAATALAAAALPALATADLPIDRPLQSCFDLERFERLDWSQCGEDGVLEALFAHLGTTNRQYAEFGCGDGLQCNTTALRRAGWQGVLMDGEVKPGAPDAVIQQAWITAENIEALLDQHGVPAEPDLLSIDLDGNDYWVWQAIQRRPRVVVAEYNANLAADRALTIAYDPAHQWNGTDYYGASLLALVSLARRKGYTLVYCTQAGVNAFFVRDDLLRGEGPVDPAALYRPPNYWYRGARSLPDLSRAMVAV